MKKIQFLFLYTLIYTNNIIRAETPIKELICNTSNESIFVTAGKRAIIGEIAFALPLATTTLTKTTVESLITNNKYVSAGIFGTASFAAGKKIIDTANTEHIKTYYSSIEQVVNQVAKPLNLQNNIGTTGENIIFTILPITGCAALINASSNLIGYPTTMASAISTCTAMHGAFLAATAIERSNLSH